MTDRDLLRHIERLPNSRAGYKQLIRELGLGGGRERRELREQLGRLTGSRQLVQVDGDHWVLAGGAPASGEAGRGTSGVERSPGKREARIDDKRTASGRGIRGDNLVAGRLDLHRDGYGFVRPTPAQPGAKPPIDQDVFIPPGEMGGAMQGDQVLVELAPPRFGRGDNRRSGRVLRILTRRNPTVVGIFHYSRRLEGESSRGGNVVVPFDERMTQTIVIPLGAEVPAVAAEASSPHRVLGREAQAARGLHPGHQDLEGLVVDVEITDWPTPTRAARGRVLEVLGAEDDFGVDVEMVIRKHHLPRIFPDAVLDEAREVARLDPEIVARRRDFRELPIVTIDGETARDFDDAVLVRHGHDGIWEFRCTLPMWRSMCCRERRWIWRRGCAGPRCIFRIARFRCCRRNCRQTFAACGRTKSGWCCLPDADRCAGEIMGYEVTEGVIRSARRMTYTQVRRILDGDAERGRVCGAGAEFERMSSLRGF